MSILIAFISPNDPCPPTLVDGLSKAGPILSVLRHHSFSEVILLATPESLEKTPQVEHMVRAENTNTPIHLIYLKPEGNLSYRSALTALQAALAQWQKNTDVYLLPSTADSTWHVASIFLLASEYLQGTILNPLNTGPSIINLPALSTDGLCLPEIAMAEGAFIDDIAQACGLEGQHPLFREALETAAALAAHDTPILILGETGTGKDAFARFVHAMSERAGNPFITVNCAALPESLAESILFGHMKGAFTGAIHNQTGKFTQAHGGTLFLDELGELPLKIQAKLLRVIEDGIVDPLGSNKPEKVNVRLVAATNRNIELEVQEGRFREDLYYRLRVGEFSLPALRERKSDITSIALFLLKRINKSLKEARTLHPTTLEVLEKYPWPGNIRDLQNVLERAAILTSSSLLKPEDLRLATPLNKGEIPQLPELGFGFSIEDYISLIRQALLAKALYQAQGNQSEAARLLGITPQAVNRFVRDKEAPLPQSLN